MKKALIVIAALVLLFLTVFGILYVITRPEVPPLPPLEEATTSGAFEMSDRRTVVYENALFTVPESWKITDETGGMCLTPPGGEGKARVEYYPENDFAVCGTGLRQVSVLLLDGVKATKGYYDESEIWSYICAENGYVMLNEGLSGENADIAESVMLTMKEKGANGSGNAAPLKTYDISDLSPELAWVGWSETDFTELLQLFKNNMYYPMSSRQALPTAVIADKTELEEWKKKTKDIFQLEARFSNENGEYRSFSEITEKCDEKFFEKNALLVTYITENTGSASHTLESAQLYDNSLEMIIKTDIPEAYTADMAGWLLCTVFPRGDVTGLEYVNSWR